MQLIDTGFDIHKLALIGNVLLVEWSSELAGWHLTAEGTVGGAMGNRRANSSDRLWTKSVPKEGIQFWAEDHIRAIKSSAEYVICYNMETGEELEAVLVRAPSPSSSSWKDIHKGHDEFGTYCSFSHHDFIEYNNSSEDDLLSPIPWYENGWVKYPEGKY